MTATLPRPAPGRLGPGTDGIVVIGVDPGETVGVTGLRWSHDRKWPPTVLQIEWQSAMDLLRYLTGRLYRPTANSITYLGVEKFVEGNRSKATRGHGAITRDLISQIVQLGDMATKIVQWPAATHKPWATDHRLKVAGLYDLTAGVGRHARDASRVAMYTAVYSVGVPDPLSRDSQGLWFG